MVLGLLYCSRFQTGIRPREHHGINTIGALLELSPRALGQTLSPRCLQPREIKAHHTWAAILRRDLSSAAVLPQTRISPLVLRLVRIGYCGYCKNLPGVVYFTSHAGPVLGATLADFQSPSKAKQVLPPSSSGSPGARPRDHARFCQSRFFMPLIPREGTGGEMMQSVRSLSQFAKLLHQSARSAVKPCPAPAACLKFGECSCEGIRLAPRRVKKDTSCRG